jgi:FKBP-type peptidyl-prolyl cis-trans isomerase
VRLPLIRIAFCVFASVAFAGCSSSLTAPSNAAPYSQTDLVVGTGITAEAADSLTVNYTGWLYDTTQPNDKGAVFDSSQNSSFVFTLGAGAVIAGWDQGIVGMNVGGVRRLVIPPSLAYGAARSGIIPPNATLLFEIQLVADARTTS